MNAAHIAAALETASGKEISDAQLGVANNGVSIFTGTFVDACGVEWSLGFAVTPDGWLATTNAVARTFEGR